MILVDVEVVLVTIGGVMLEKLEDTPES